MTSVGRTLKENDEDWYVEHMQTCHLYFLQESACSSGERAMCWNEKRICRKALSKLWGGNVLDMGVRINWLPTLYYGALEPTLTMRKHHVVLFTKKCCRKGELFPRIGFAKTFTLCSRRKCTRQPRFIASIWSKSLYSDLMIREK